MKLLVFISALVDFLLCIWCFAKAVSNKAELDKLLKKPRKPFGEDNFSRDSKMLSFWLRFDSDFKLAVFFLAFGIFAIAACS